MAQSNDPPSTRCTFVLAIDEPELFEMATPGDRLELVEPACGRDEVRVVTARVLRVRKVPKTAGS